MTTGDNQHKPMGQKSYVRVYGDSLHGRVLGWTRTGGPDKHRTRVRETRGVGKHPAGPSRRHPVQAVIRHEAESVQRLLRGGYSGPNHLALASPDFEPWRSP